MHSLEVTMPGIAHEAPVELLRRNPLLAATLLHGTGVQAPAGGLATMVAGDVSSALPAELRADAVILLGGPDAGTQRLAVVVEVQRSPVERKRRVWPAYLTLAGAQHDCPVVLVVICPDRGTGRWARRPIATGHPGFDLVPVVIDADATPLPGEPGLVAVAAELAVLAAFTGAMDLEADSDRRAVLGTIAAAQLDPEQLETYTHLVRACASSVARKALEALMTTAFKDEFIDRIKAEGKAEGRVEGKAEGRAEGEADMLLRVLAARGFEVPGSLREQVLACTDVAQLVSWGDKAVGAASLDEVFSG